MRMKTTAPLSLIALLLAQTPTGTAQQTASDAQLEARARAVHDKVLKLDAHVDVLLPTTPKQYWHKDGTSFASLDKLEKGGIDALALAIAVGPGPRTPEGVAEARREADQKLAAIRAFIASRPDRLELAKTAADIERIHKVRKIAVLESFLNARSLGAELKGIDHFHAEGVRLFAFTHAAHNDFADSSRPQAGEPAEEHRGLSAVGKQAVARLNQLGVIVDVSQLTPAGVKQVLELTKAPVIASHSDVRALLDNTRNLSDAELDGIKANGGVVHVTAFNAYLKKPTPEFLDKARALRTEYGLSGEFPATLSGASSGYNTLPAERQRAFTAKLSEITPRATVADLVDHIDYLVKRIGVDHVGIGTDFNHGAGINGFGDESEAFNVTRELVRRGYTEEQIGKIWSGNFLRVFRAVEQTAQRLKTSGASPSRSQ